MPRKQFYETTAMIADKPFRYGTRRLLAGEPFDARSKDIVILKALKRAHPARDKANIPEIPEALKRKVVPPVIETLYGSSVLQSTYEIGGATVQLGTIVANAHKESGLSVDEWNHLQSGDREARLANELKRLQDAAAPSASDDDDEDEDEDDENEEEVTEEEEEEKSSESEKTPEELLADARARYKEIVGRAAYGAWDVAKIEENIAAFQAAQAKK